MRCSSKRLNLIYSKFQLPLNPPCKWNMSGSLLDLSPFQFHFQILKNILIKQILHCFDNKAANITENASSLEISKKDERADNCKV